MQKQQYTATQLKNIDMNPTIKLTAPKTLADMRFKHLPAYMDKQWLEKGAQNDVETVVRFVSIFFGIMPQVIKTIDWKDLQKVYGHLMSVFGSFSMKAPDKQITINGKVYDLVNLKKPTTGWVIDANLSDFQKDPVRLACLCYVPEGTTYGQIDEGGSLIHPIEERHEDFKQHFPLDKFLQLQAFFLRQFATSIDKSMAKAKTRRKGRRLKARVISGWNQLIS